MENHDPSVQSTQSMFPDAEVARSADPNTPPAGWEICSPRLLGAGVNCATAPRWSIGEEGPHWHPPVGLSALTAFQVGDYDVVAAYDSEGALAVLREQTGDDDDDFTTADVVMVSQKTLDSLEAFDQDEGKIVPLKVSLRQELATLTKPTYLYGWD